MFFPVGAEAVIHVALAVGTFLIGLSVFDFEAPSWLKSVFLLPIAWFLFVSARRTSRSS